MKIKILQVFYGEDGLPYKDQARTVHYPITGSGFQNANNTTQIRFYFSKLSGENTTWVAVSKIPNGRIGSKVLETYNDNEINEPYALLELDSFYTQYKGDVFISLQGYQNGVQVEYDAETEIYTITGTPTIASTGSIKFTNNYAPSFVGSGETQNITFQELLGYLSTKANVSDIIFVVENIATEDLSGYEENQLFYDKTTELYYNQDKTLAEDIGLLGSKKAIARYVYNVSDQKTTQQMYNLFGVNTFVLNVQGQEYLIKLIDNGNSTFKFSALNIVSRVYWYKESLNASDYIVTALSSANVIQMVQQTNTNSIVYGTSPTGNQTNIPYSQNSVGSALVQRTANGFVNVPVTPTQDQHAASKKYVDDQIASFKENELQVVNELPSTGEEGIIYLLPIDISDLTKGYYRYIWENNEWLSLGTTEIDLSDYYTKTETDEQIDNAKDDINANVPKHQATTVLIIDPLTNINGRAFQNYTSQEVTVGGYQAVKILRSGVTLSEQYAKEYMEYMCGSYYLPKYNYDYPKNTYFIMPNGQLLKPQYDSTNGLLLFYSGKIATQDVVDTLISDLENGYLVVDKARVTQQIENVSEESGVIQETPFISQGTSTSNNTEETPTAPIAKQLEKQGNSVVVNQLAKELNSSNYDNYGSTVTYSNGIATFTASAQYGSLYTKSGTSNRPSVVSGHKYLFIFDYKLTTGTQGGILFQIRKNDDSGNEISIGSANTTAKTTASGIFTASASSSVYVRVIDIRASSWDAVQFSNVMLIDLTQHFGSNDAIPQDLLDHPEHWSWYDNTDNAYNTGILDNSTGRYLVCTGRNQWDEVAESGYFDLTTGQPVANASIMRSANFIRVNPNVNYYYRSNGQNHTILFYDNNYNYISNLQYGTGDNTFTIPQNCIYIKFAWVGTAYSGGITISVYYTTGDGYDQYYPYVQPKVYDTGVETLRSAGSVKDYKTPDGTIHRLVGVVDLGELNWENYSSPESHVFRISLTQIGAKPTTANNVLGNAICPRYTLLAFQPISANDNMCFAVSSVSNNRIVFVNQSYSTTQDFKTAMSGIYLYYELDTPTTEQGTPFPENIEVDDYGTMYWLDTNNELVSIPQGTKLFYPADYVLLMDDLNIYTNGDVSKLALKTWVESQGYVKQEDLSSGITDNAGLTYLVKKAYRVSNVVTLTIFAKNETGSAITENTKLFTLSSGMYINEQYFSVIVDSPLKVYINTDNGGSCTLSGGNLNNNGTIKLIVTYAVA